MMISTTLFLELEDFLTDKLIINCYCVVTSRLSQTLFSEAIIAFAFVRSCLGLDGEGDEDGRVGWGTRDGDCVEVRTARTLSVITTSLRSNTFHSSRSRPSWIAPSCGAGLETCLYSR